MRLDVAIVSLHQVGTEVPGPSGLDKDGALPRPDAGLVVWVNRVRGAVQTAQSEVWQSTTQASGLQDWLFVSGPQ